MCVSVDSVGCETSVASFMLYFLLCKMYTHNIMYIHVI